MKRSSLARKTPLKARSALRRTGPLRTVSAKKAKRRVVQASVRERVFERDGHTCRVRVIVPHIDCTSGLHPHHRWLSSQGGPDAVWNEIAVCPGHHDWIHANPADARELGLYSATGQEPAFKRLTATLEGQQ